MFAFMFDNKNAFASQRIASNQIYFDKAEKNWANNSFNHIQIDKIVLRSIYSPYTGAIIAIWGLGRKTIALNVIAANRLYRMHHYTNGYFMHKVFVSHSLKGNMDDWQ